MTGKEYNENLLKYLDQMTWKDIPGWEGYYQASDWGLIKSLLRIIIYENGINKRINETILVPSITSERFAVSLARKGTKKTWPIHQLVAITFYGKCPEGMEVCHEDNNPFNNKKVNLRYDTEKNNQRDRLKFGTDLRGEKNPLHKLTKEQVIKIRELRKTGIYTLQKLGLMFGVHYITVNDITRGKSWGWLKDA